jgi:hypothetical protein
MRAQATHIIRIKEATVAHPSHAEQEDEEYAHFTREWQMKSPDLKRQTMLFDVKKYLP